MSFIGLTPALGSILSAKKLSDFWKFPQIFQNVFVSKYPKENCWKFVQPAAPKYCFLKFLFFLICGFKILRFLSKFLKTLIYHDRIEFWLFKRNCFVRNFGSAEIVRVWVFWIRCSSPFQMYTKKGKPFVLSVYLWQGKIAPPSH